jgi:hypothetical protein
MTCIALFASIAAAAEKCCECGCEYKLKKVYHPVVTFKPVTFKAYKYCTTCEDVLAPTDACCPSCGKCGEKKCGCFGRPHFLSVPVAVQSECRECTRMVPCVTWVVECKCEACCKKCQGHHGH